MTHFTTLAGPAQHRLVVKESVFLAYASRADAASEALGFLQSVAQAYADASHLCWAYRIGLEYRFSDGGEPGGTAGQPILRAIEGQGFDHVVVGVIRYFGGTKLGAGGLVRAYGGLAAEVLRSAERATVAPLKQVKVTVGFDHLGALYHVLDRFGVADRRENYSEDGVTVQAVLPADQVDGFQEALRDATKGQFS